MALQKSILTYSGSINFTEKNDYVNLVCLFDNPVYTKQVTRLQLQHNILIMDI